jgi:outer membrane protein OmpA-like peptidoglycan-associated protein
MGAQDCKCPDDPKKRLEKAAFNYFDHVERQINLAVTKSSLLVATAALAGGIFVRFATEHRGLLVDRLSLVLVALTGALLLSGLLFALASIWPRFTPAKNAYGPMFFGSVAQDELDDFKKKFGELGNQQALYDEVLSQIWGKSKWLKQMYKRAAWSILCLGAGTVFATFAILSLDRAEAPVTRKTAETVLQMEISLDGLIVDSSRRKAVELDCGKKPPEKYLIGTFAPGKDFLQDKDENGIRQRSIDKQVEDALSKMKDDAKGRKLQGILLVGSADKTIPQEGHPTNDQLAERRSNAVKKILDERKADLDELKLTSRMIVSFSPELPIARLIVEKKTFDAMRGVRICAIWEERTEQAATGTAP